jgi:hypothetical protein
MKKQYCKYCGTSLKKDSEECILCGAISSNGVSFYFSESTNNHHLKIKTIIILLVAILLITSVIYIKPYLIGMQKSVEPFLYIGGTNYTWGDLKNNAVYKTIQAESGPSLSDIINYSGFSNPANYQFQSIAADTYNKNVTWGNMMEGIIIYDAETGLKSLFPSLGNKYNIENILEIIPLAKDVLVVNGFEYTWDQPFDGMFEEKSIGNYTGVSLSDIVTHTNLANPGTYLYQLIAEDDYTKSVNWSSMNNGILVLDQHRIWFEFLPLSYNMKMLATIQITEVP